jgi:protein AIR1/2
VQSISSSPVPDPEAQILAENNAAENSGATLADPHVISDSSDSEASLTEDDCIMLNMGNQPENHADAGDQALASWSMGGKTDGPPRQEGRESVQSRPVSVQNMTSNGSKPHQEAKEAAIASFTSKYATPPATLADLRKGDLELQAKYIYYSLPIGQLDLSQAIRCTDCLKDGHLAEICPDKEVCAPFGPPIEAADEPVYWLDLTGVANSVNTVAHGRCTKADFVLSGCDVKSVGSVATTKQHANHAFENYRPSSRAISAGLTNT